MLFRSFDDSEIDSLKQTVASLDASDIPHISGRLSLREIGQFHHMLGNAPIAPHVALGVALRRCRQAAGLSQEQLGLEAGVQRNFISLIETGQNQPSITTVFKLAGALGMKASELVAEAESEIVTKQRRHRPDPPKPASRAK